MDCDFRNGVGDDTYVPHPLSYPMTGGRRFELGSSGYDWKAKLKHAISGAGEVIRQLEQQERDLEILWQPVLNRWVLYRVVKRAGCAGMDRLSCVYVLQDKMGRPQEPGEWLIRLLRKADRAKRGANNRKEAAAMVAQEAQSARAKLEMDSQRRTSEFSTETAKQLVDVVREKKHFIIPGA